MNPMPTDDHSSSGRPAGPASRSDAASGRGSRSGASAPGDVKPDGTDVRRRNNVTVTGREDGPVLLLAHGFGCDQNMWRLVVPMLAEDFRVVLFDYVGSGRSDPSAWDERRYSSLEGYARDVLEVCEELDLREVTFVGHSVSAMVGVLAAAGAPQRFSRLVMVAPSPRYIDEDGYRGGFSAEDIDELLESLESNYLGWSAAMAPVIMGNADQPELGQELTASFCATDPDMARVFARTTFLSDSRDDLKTVAVPTLVLECRQDVIAPREVGAYVHAAVPGSRLVTLEATGHCPQLSAPQATAGAIIDFIGAAR
ncbi:alpha/beta fold hydrolase [Streptomyces sp. NBC_01013]|uniref:alpha/beta fold hydrolase n=1 Tax=Streptomyces sp. NBC_01013 TaxID=2903718 RepID=UPI00386B1B94|nr:alpha/beta hydrolase [Streptomyces sp. NBC_01013]